MYGDAAVSDDVLVFGSVLWMPPTTKPLKRSLGSGVTALTSLTATLLGAVQLDAGPPLNGPDVPREVRELRRLFACRPVFQEAAQLLLAGLRARRS